ncbi:MAG: hypothetical protein OHK0056_25080 [Bacteriovoracaceae bacterium]
MKNISSFSSPSSKTKPSTPAPNANLVTEWKIVDGIMIETTQSFLARGGQIDIYNNRRVLQYSYGLENSNDNVLPLKKTPSINGEDSHEDAA